MRLTLRTLLAYLDDVLEPSQTKEIGQKIQESPVAAALMSRVREVVRRRRLGSPDLEGAGQGIDPNIVAQYLDNTLREDRVSDVERVCLESDQQLAEVAACHQILTLVLSDPQEMHPERLERLYALGPVPTSTTLKAAAPSVPEATSPSLVPAGQTGSQFRESLPDYLKPAPWSQQMAPAAMIAIVVIAAVFALALDRDLARTLMGLRTAQPEQEMASTEVAPPAESETSRPPSPKPKSPSDSTTNPSATDRVAMNNLRPDDQPISVLPEGIDLPPPPDQPERTMPAPFAAPAPATPPATAVVAAPTVPPPPPVKTETPTHPEPAPAELPATEPPHVRVPMRYTSTEGILMRYDPRDQHWHVQPRRSELHANETFGSPEPFEATFDLDDGTLNATLLVDTVWSILPATVDHRIRLALKQGRLILERKGGEKADAPLLIDLQAGSRLWTLELGAGAQRCALDLQHVRPRGLPLPLDDEAFRLALFVPQGRVMATTADRDPVTVNAGEMSWLSRPKSDSNPLTDPQPAWLDSNQRTTSTTLRRYAQLFEREFDPDVAIDLSIPALSKDPRPKIAELATRCLSTMQEPSALVTALVRSEHAEARTAAAQGLRLWLVSGPDRAELLRQELKQHYPDEEAQAVFHLLIGMPESEAQDEEKSREFITLLRSNFVEVRELAIDELELLTGRRYDYRATGSPSQREPAIQRWLAHLDREGALIRVDD